MGNTRAGKAMMNLAEDGGPLDFSPDRARLFVRVARELAQLGRPIAGEQFDRIVAELAVAPEEAQRFLDEWTERDRDGAIVGMGLTLNETPHQISVNGARLWAWCAEDTLFYPVVLDQAATIASASPVSGELTRLRVSPTQVEEVSPAEAVVSLPVVDPDGADLSSVNAIWNTFCHHSFFFPSRAEAEQWAAGREDIEIVPVEEGFAIGRLLAARMLANAS
jgi:alkylmercury lyase